MLIVQVLLIALALYVCYRVIRALFMSGARAGFKCRNCVHAKAIHDDGVICRWGNREVFKNAVHIENCVDHTPK